MTRMCDEAESCLLMYPLSTVALRLYTIQFVGSPSTLWSVLLGILNLKSHSWYPALILCAFAFLSEQDTGNSVRVSTRKLVFCVIGCGLTVLVKCHLSWGSQSAFCSNFLSRELSYETLRVAVSVMRTLRTEIDSGLFSTNLPLSSASCDSEGSP